MSYKVTIHTCSNCASHAYCTRHDEATYLSLANDLKSKLQSNHNNVKVDIIKVGAQGGGKLGSFEVQCEGCKLFSKLELGYFPHTQLLATRIGNFISDLAQGKDVSRFRENISPLKQHPQFKKENSVRSPAKTKINNSSVVLPSENASKISQTSAKKENKNTPKKIEVKNEEKPALKLEEKKQDYQSTPKQPKQQVKKEEVKEEKREEKKPSVSGGVIDQRPVPKEEPRKTGQLSMSGGGGQKVPVNEPPSWYKKLVDRKEETSSSKPQQNKQEPEKSREREIEVASRNIESESVPKEQSLQKLVQNKQEKKQAEPELKSQPKADIPSGQPQKPAQPTQQAEPTIEIKAPEQKVQSASAYSSVPVEPKNESTEKAVEQNEGVKQKIEEKESPKKEEPTPV